MSNEALSNLLHEERTFPPSEDFAAGAVAQADLYDEATKDRLAFWATQADRLEWAARWDDVLDWQPPFAKWFVGGKLNVAYNCVDRHVEAGNGDKVALHWVGEPGRHPHHHLPRAQGRGLQGRERADVLGRAAPATGWPSTSR